jgi:hypothetical protein
LRAQKTQACVIHRSSSWPLGTTPAATYEGKIKDIISNHYTKKRNESKSVPVIFPESHGKDSRRQRPGFTLQSSAFSTEVPRFSLPCSFFPSLSQFLRFCLKLFKIISTIALSCPLHAHMAGKKLDKREII